MANIIEQLKNVVGEALGGMGLDEAAVRDAVELVRPSQDLKFGDYQANCAMSLSKALGRPKESRQVAEEIVGKLKEKGILDLCDQVEVAGPGFVNLRIRDDKVREWLQQAAGSDRLGVELSAKPKKVVVDFSGPNVAKPMHVGHIRSTVIGDSIVRTLRFLGHTVVGDNHLGDWGTQFGMILYGYRNFLDRDAYDADRVQELARVYRLVRQLWDYHAAKKDLPALEQRIEAKKEQAEALADPKAKKKALASLADDLDEAKGLRKKIEAVETSPLALEQARQHAEVTAKVLAETAKLHAGDAENWRLWNEFMPACRAEIDGVYQRLGVTFDETLGESFYHDQLASVVEDLKAKKLAVESDGAWCVFLEGHENPFLIQKRDGAFLYATTDLATIRYRIERWKPDAVLYVVDHRQGVHFEQLFATARLWGYQDVELAHVSFGAVLGEDGKPIKTRDGDTIGLNGLLDDAVAKAGAVVAEKSPDLPRNELAQVAEVLGIAAVKYGDLSQNRTNDYKFSLNKMVAMDGNTATYMQFAYARCRGILRKSEVDIESLKGQTVLLDAPAERALGLEILKFSEALAQATVDYRPNQLTNYLWELAKKLSVFYEECPVLKPEVPEDVKKSRLVLCDLTARVLAKTMELLGIQVVDRM